MKKQNRVGYADGLLQEWLDTIFGSIALGSKRNCTENEKQKAAFLADLDRLWQRTVLAEGMKAEYGLQEFVAKYSLTKIETLFLVTLLLHYLCGQLSQHFEPMNVMTFGVKDSSSMFDVLRILEPTSNICKSKLIDANHYHGYRLSRKTIKELMNVTFVRDGREEREPYGKRGDDETFTEQITPRVSLADLVLPPNTKDELADALYYIKNQKQLLEKWGMSSTMEKGKGSILLFWGLPGTGKTMAAEAMANELGVKMSIVSPDKIVNCFFGQTEKNIVRLFEQAKRKKLMLVFDECDSLFHARPDGSQYQNSIIARDVNILLHQVEEFDGVCILTTNRAHALDEALDRRLSAKVHFDMPDATGRLHILNRLLPPNNTISEDELTELAQKHRVSGGYIKQAVMAALRRAVREERPICIKDLEEKMITSSEEKGIGF